MFRQVITSSAAAGLLAAGVGGWQPVAAQDAAQGMFGAGPDRVCNTLIDARGQSVLETGGEDAVFTKHTYDCPEEEVVAAVIEPAAPPPEALPASGLVLFDFDQADLNPEAQDTMSRIIAEIQGRELGGITVGGHTDTAGPADYNMGLSQRRANTVAAELVRAGIPAEIVTTEAFGQTDLAVETPDETPLQADRRVTVDFER
jgi:outer membrane protein OmpA-like peptidoglycan-associated protein